MTRNMLNKTIFLTVVVATFWAFLAISIISTRDALALAQTVSSAQTPSAM